MTRQMRHSQHVMRTVRTQTARLNLHREKSAGEDADMSSVDAIQAARAVGVNVIRDGDDLVLEFATDEPPAEVVERLRQHKAAVVALLRSDGDPGINPGASLGCRRLADALHRTGCHRRIRRPPVAP